MILTGLLINVMEKNVTGNDGRPKCVYSAFMIDNDDPTNYPLKISLDDYNQADQFRSLIRQEISIVVYASSWTYNDKRGVSFKYVGNVITRGAA